MEVVLEKGMVVSLMGHTAGDAEEATTWGLMMGGDVTNFAGAVKERNGFVGNCFYFLFVCS